MQTKRRGTGGGGRRRIWDGRRRRWIGLYKIFFYFEAFVHESIIPFLPPPTCIAHTIALLLHDYCAIYDSPPTPLVYAIHHTILVMAILCKGQAVEGYRRRGGRGVGS